MRHYAHATEENYSARPSPIGDSKSLHRCATSRLSANCCENMFLLYLKNVFTLLYSSSSYIIESFIHIILSVAVVVVVVTLVVTVVV